MPTDLGVRILVIEDDPATLHLFGEVLADSGLAMVGADHDQLPGQGAFSVVVTDLPRRNVAYTSESAVEWVRQLAVRYTAPVIVLTGRAEAWKDNHLRTMAEVMSKPMDVDDFVLRVRAALASA